MMKLLVTDMTNGFPIAVVDDEKIIHNSFLMALDGCSVDIEFASSITCCGVITQQRLLYSQKKPCPLDVFVETNTSEASML